MPDPSKDKAPARPLEKAQPRERLERADELVPRSIKVEPWPTGRPNNPPPGKAGK